MVDELVPMGDLTFVKDTFIAVDVEDPEVPTGGRVVRFVGTVVEVTKQGFAYEETLRLQDPDSDLVRDILTFDIVKGWWAPMGYRP